MKNEKRIEELLADMLRSADRQVEISEKQTSILERHTGILEKHGNTLDKNSLLLEHLAKGQDKLTDQFERLFAFLQEGLIRRMDEMDARIRKLEQKP